RLPRREGCPSQPTGCAASTALRDSGERRGLVRSDHEQHGRWLAGDPEARAHLPTLLPTLSAALLDGTYRPGDIRRVWIPKANGGQRGLGIPNVVDRMVQEATRAVLEPLWEPTFHPSSHGFRPNRSCHTAITEARQHIEEGYEWVVDMDVEKFFDKVHHQRLMARVSTRINDRRLLVLIGAMLKAAVVLPDGVHVTTEEGVPQGGPLSPLLANIVLDELDQELARRGHRFVRYADDCNIYVRTERAGQRVMESVSGFISKRLRLKVNAEKSAVSRTGERHFLGFRVLVSATGKTKVLLSTRSKERIKASIRERTPRNWGCTLKACILKINAYLRGWMGFFGICDGEVGTMQALDAHIRRRLRAILLVQWKGGPPAGECGGEPALLVLWERLVGDLLDRTAKFPKAVRFTFAARIDGIALDFLERIAEARVSASG
ncbi:MAG: group II intron reverse transcriptase/maturase, partial [Myxococcales bacterium]|nr:group II intron reverse transcriptase/maturase [Myxococcales bacterium]